MAENGLKYFLNGRKKMLFKQIFFYDLVPPALFWATKWNVFSSHDFYVLPLI